MGYESIGEAVQVGAVFNNNTVQPKWFVWNNRKYPVREITYTWQVNQGETILVYFSVSDGASLYAIYFNKKTMRWFLDKVYVE